MKQEDRSDSKQDNVVSNNEKTGTDDSDDFVTLFVVCNVRKGPGTKYELMGALASEEKVKLLGKEEATGGSGVWYKIEYEGKEAYIAATTASEGNHVHTPVMIYGTAATCTASGKSSGTKCSTCGAVLKAQTTTAPLGHNLTNVAAKAPTKNTTGWYDYKKCTRCSYSTYKARTMKAGSWSGWSTNAVSATNTRDVETKVEKENVYVTKYHYSRYKYWNTTYNAWYYSWTTYVGGGEWQYKITDSPLAFTKWVEGHKEYTDIWWNETTTQEVDGTKDVTYYRYRDYTE